MKFSIVTISFNQAEYLEEAICSVLEQDYQFIEYIIVDPGSTDGSREIIEKYRGQIDRVIFEPDNGPADGLNKGFRHANGEIYGFLNSDDRLRPGAISKIAKAFDKTSNAIVISGHGFIIDSEGKIRRKIFSHRFSLQAYAYGVCTLVQQASFFKKNAFWEVGGFNTENRVNWDGELWVDLANHGAKFQRIHNYIADFRIYDSSITGSGAFSKEYQKQHNRIFQKIGILPKSQIKRRIIWSINRLTDPIAFVARLVDRLKYEFQTKT